MCLHLPYQFIIHPFPDGNGRVARLIASYVLIADNLFPFTVEHHAKVAYIKALEQADAKDLTAFIKYVVATQTTEVTEALRIMN